MNIMEHTPLTTDELYATIAGAYSDLLSDLDPSLEADRAKISRHIVEYFGSEDKAADLLGRVLMMTPAIDNFQTEQQEHIFEYIRVGGVWVTTAQRPQTN